MKSQIINKWKPILIKKNTVLNLKNKTLQMKYSNFNNVSVIYKENDEKDKSIAKLKVDLQDKVR